jgi:hypothetical protein
MSNAKGKITTGDGPGHEFALGHHRPEPILRSLAAML